MAGNPFGALCPCGARDCEKAEIHAAVFAIPDPRWRSRRRGSRKHRRKR